MTNAPTLLAGDDMLNGLIRLANGTVQYLQNGEPTFAGLVRSDAGDYYFIGPSKRALSNITYTFPTKYTNGLLPAGTYTFDSTGKIAQLPELLAGDDYGTDSSGCRTARCSISGTDSRHLQVF